jgi:hypothetical protein
LADLLSEHRLFDVAFNDYTGEGRGTEGAEWRFCEKGHKWPCAHRNLSRIAKSYEFYFFIDNDIAIGVEDINTLFLTGYALRLKLFQAALTPDSATAYPNLVWRGGCAVRFCDFVEIMTEEEAGRKSKKKSSGEKSLKKIQHTNLDVHTARFTGRSLRLWQGVEPADDEPARTRVAAGFAWKAQERSDSGQTRGEVPSDGHDKGDPHSDVVRPNGARVRASVGLHVAQNRRTARSSKASGLLHAACS